jgi:hypothetical protein
VIWVTQHSKQGVRNYRFHCLPQFLVRKYAFSNLRCGIGRLTSWCSTAGSTGRGPVEHSRPLRPLGLVVDRLGRRLLLLPDDDRPARLPAQLSELPETAN